MNGKRGLIEYFTPMTRRYPGNHPRQQPRECSKKHALSLPDKSKTIYIVFRKIPGFIGFSQKSMLPAAACLMTKNRTRTSQTALQKLDK